MSVYMSVKLVIKLPENEELNIEGALPLNDTTPLNVFVPKNAFEPVVANDPVFIVLAKDEVDTAIVLPLALPT